MSQYRGIYLITFKSYKMNHKVDSTFQHIWIYSESLQAAHMRITSLAQGKCIDNIAHVSSLSELAKKCAEQTILDLLPQKPLLGFNCTGCNQFLFWIQAAKDAIRWHWGPRWRLPSESHGSQGCSQHPTCHGENLANKDVA